MLITHSADKLTDSQLAAVSAHGHGNIACHIYYIYMYMFVYDIYSGLCTEKNELEQGGAVREGN